MCTLVSAHTLARPSAQVRACMLAGTRTCVCVCDPRLLGWRAGETAAPRAGAGQGVRTRVGRAVGQRQVGAGAPGPGAEVPLALAAVGAGGVVLTLALQAALPHGAQVRVQVALAPGGHRGPERSAKCGQAGREGDRGGLPSDLLGLSFGTETPRSPRSSESARSTLSQAKAAPGAPATHPLPARAVPAALSAVPGRVAR